MNMQQLQYLVEIERTCSISQAAANLYIGQPNLSRVLREVEAAVGFQIFERTRRGVRATEKGQSFLHHAKNILREMEFMENLGPNCAQQDRFRVCIPKSYSLFALTGEYLKRLQLNMGLDAMVQECHPKRALDLVDSGSTELGVLRYRAEYQDYFAEQIVKREMTSRFLGTVRYAPVVSQRCALASADKVERSALRGLTEIVHSDMFARAGRQDAVRRIYTTDRLAQMQLLRDHPDVFMWSEPLSEGMLAQFSLVQLNCEGGGRLYRDELIYKPQCAMSQIEQDFIRVLQARYGK